MGTQKGIKLLMNRNTKGSKKASKAPSITYRRKSDGVVCCSPAEGEKNVSGSVVE